MNSKMQRTILQQKTDTNLAARRVARRVLGDLLAIHEKFDMDTESNVRNLAHDLELGLAHDCIESLKLFLYRKGATAPRRAYQYERVAAGSFSASAHSGRIVLDTLLVGGRLEFEVRLRDRKKWESLKADGNPLIRWGPCDGRSMSGMSSSSNGGYTSGSIGFARTCFTQEDE